MTPKLRNASTVLIPFSIAARTPIFGPRLFERPRDGFALRFFGNDQDAVEVSEHDVAGHHPYGIHFDGYAEIDHLAPA